MKQRNYILLFFSGAGNKMKAKHFAFKMQKFYLIGCPVLEL